MTRQRPPQSGSGNCLTLVLLTLAASAAAAVLAVVLVGSDLLAAPPADLPPLLEQRPGGVATSAAPTAAPAAAAPAATDVIAAAPPGAQAATPTPPSLPTVPARPPTVEPLQAMAQGLLALFLPQVSNSEAVEPRQAEAFILLPTPESSDWPAARPGLTASKLSAHVIGRSDPYVMEFVRRAKPRVIKALDDFGWLAEVKQVSPETITIARVNGQDESWFLTLDPAEAARVFIDQREAHYRLNPAVDYWEGWNETVPVSDERWAWFAQFEAERACQMQARGWHAAVGGFSYGTPEYAQMALFLPALEAAHRCGGIFTLHEGVPPSTTTCRTVTTGLENAIPGAPAFQVPVGYHALRYRFWYEGYLKPRGLGDLPLVISELAVAPEPACGFRGGDAWMDYTDWWPANGVGPDGPLAYLNLLAWYDREMQHDPYVIGATIFTAGAVNPGNPWHLWDLHDVLIPLAHYAVSQP